MEIDIDWWAVVAASMAGMVIAFVWYSDWGVFGRVWRRLTGVTPEDSKGAGAAPMVVLVVSIVVTAVALAAGYSIASQALDRDSVWLAPAVGVIAWLGFSASTLVQHNSFELKPPRLTLINCAYQLVLFAGMALVIGLLQ